MSDLVAIAFPSEAKAEELRQKLLDMQKDYLIELDDAVIAVKQPNGRVKLNQLFHPARGGAAAGGLWGLLVGFFFMMPLAGAALAGSRRARRCSCRCRDQRPIHEGRHAVPAARQCRALPADPAR
jgi:uncharacterized membrane protein